MRVVLALVAATWVIVAYPKETLVQRLEKTKVCSKTECTYRAGKDLQFTIAGIGQADVGSVFERSAYEGDYYASMGMAHGCVIVHNGKAKGSILTELAFVSPKTGRAYSTWQDCQRATK